MQGQQRLVDRERLLDKVKGTQLRGAHGRLDGAVAGNHDDQRRVVEGLNFLERLETIYRGQPDVKQHHVTFLLGEELETLFAARDRLGPVAFVLKDPGKGLANPRFVVHDKDGVFHRKSEL